MIIRLIIQTIRLVPSGSDGIDEAPNVSRADPSGAGQIDAEHLAMELAVGASNPSRRAARPAGGGCGRGVLAYRQEAQDGAMVSAGMTDLQPDQ